MDVKLDENNNTQAEQITTAEMITEENSAAANNTANTGGAPADGTEANAGEKEKLIVGGFIFTSVEDADLARQELSKIEYLEKKLNYHLPENVLAVYNKVLESKLFKTPVGIDYLHRLQAVLKKVGIERERIAPIPIYNNYTPKALGEISEGIARQRIEIRLKKERSETEKLKSRFHTMIIFCLILIGLIGGLFYITVESENPNIINYEKSLINKYADWEQKLKERESAVREKELLFEDYDD
ncbi:MAG: hypothetical protein FWC09_05410 [Lachnospiraceae bacterium]|nr:hypothetical protein [Lachnospiraceae bacterium]